ncbi:MAG: tRNA guanosine(34) transglycosylase Tgt [Verrucomicrobiota bacterium]
MSVSRLPFRLEAIAPGSRARAVSLRTLHNVVQTPLFMPVGTQATVKAQLPQTLEEAGSQILLANTYHLLLRPGPEVFRRMGGIHGLTSWKRSFLTDSGGFQIFSLPNARSMGEEGASFQSYLDGRTILLSPEVSIATQRAIGSDIMMALDQCIPSTAGEAEARRALELTQRWAVRSLAARGDSRQALFGIVQGALFPELRRASAEGLCALPFDGFAIGGLAVGESRSEREDVCALTAEMLPCDKPRYLMGVGTPLDILEAVHRGVDMFDCIIPTQVAQRGGAFTSRGFLQLRRGVYQCSPEPLDPACPCPTCARFSRAYLHHLTKTGETLGWQLLGQHNLYFYHRLMADIRASILEGRFLELYREKRPLLHATDLENPVTPPRRTRRKRLYRLGAYEVHTAPEGFGSIRHIASGEIMHSRTPPLEEARRLYVEQPGLAGRLRLRDEETPEGAVPLVIWDVGLGAAANAMAAIQCYEAAAGGGAPLRPLHLVSFENDLDALRLARVNNALFPYLRHAAPDALLKAGAWRSQAAPGLNWTLVEGDFPATLPQAPALPDLIFYDLFSSKTDGVHWTPGAFRELATLCAGRAVEFLTYTCSTAIRASLLAAGFAVARGIGIGEKSETTVALTPEACSGRYPLLAGDWLEKWERSGAQFPPELAPEERAAFAQAIRCHPQFAGMAKEGERPQSRRGGKGGPK